MPRIAGTPTRLHALPILDDNYVWLLVDGARAVAVDPGRAEPVLACLDRLGASLSDILVTHHHGDHVGGVDGLRRAFPDVRVFGPADARLPAIDRVVAEGDTVDLPAVGLAFAVLAVPGHTLSHVAYHGGGLLFCGDTLFSAGCGRLFEGTPVQMLHSLDRLAALPAGTLVCCGHEYTLDNLAFAAAAEPGNRHVGQRIDEVAALRAGGQPSLPSTLAGERLVNPFLRIDQAQVRATLHSLRGLPPDAGRAEAFAALREWKDGFRG